jgi:hypothetical protein
MSDQESMMVAPEQSMMMAPPAHAEMLPGGHLYMQTNEIRNCVIHYLRSPNGTISEVERLLTGGSGSGVFKPISGQESAPNAFEGAHSVILTPDRRFCLLPTPAKIRSPALVSAKRASSRCWTSSRRGTS